MSHVRPTATGSLESTPLLNLLVYALDRRLQGTLVLEQSAGKKHAIFFADGAPAKVKTGDLIALLGDVLCELSIMDREVRERSYLEAEQQHLLHGQLLLQRGYVEQTQLRAALREQVARKVVFLSHLPADTLYGFYAETNLLERFGAPENVRGHALEIIWRVVRDMQDVRRAEDVLQRLGSRVVKLHHEAPIARFNFGKDEQVVLEILRAKPQPLNELEARDLLEPNRLTRLLYALFVTRQLDVGQNAHPLGIEEPPSSVRAPARRGTPSDGVNVVEPPRPGVSSVSLRAQTPAESPEVAAFRAQILERSANESETHYELLGVSRESAPAEVQTAFLSLAKKWHPDRLPPELSDLKAAASRVFARMSEASQVLQDGVRRREYDLAIKRAGKEAEEQEHVQRVLRAATAFQKAEVLMKRNNLALAEQEARQATQDDPEQADYIALLAWLEAQKPGAHLEASVKALDRALQIQPNSVRAHWYRGQLYKRMDKMGRALRDFRFVVERDPRHLDAQREIRLYLMRRGDRTTSAPPSGSATPAADGSGRTSPAPASADNKGRPSEGGLISRLFKRS